MGETVRGLLSVLAVGIAIVFAYKVSCFAAIIGLIVVLAILKPRS